MNYYSSWQEALMDFIRQNGKEYKDVSELYALMVEFELKLKINARGAYYIRGGTK